MSEADPKLGSPAPNGISSDKTTIALLWVGDCSACALHTVDIPRLYDQLPPDVELIVAAGSGELPSNISRKIRVIRLDLATQKRMNAFFAPRVYLFRSGQLSTIQSTGQYAEDIIRGSA